MNAKSIFSVFQNFNVRGMRAFYNDEKWSAVPDGPRESKSLLW